MNESQPTKSPSLIPIFLGGLLMLLLFWIGSKALYYSMPELTDEETIRSAERAEILDKILVQVDQELNQYAWKDEEKGLVQIPVERAMELEVMALQENSEIRPAYYIDSLKAAAEAGGQAPPAEETESESESESEVGTEEADPDVTSEESEEATAEGSETTNPES